MKDSSFGYIKVRLADVIKEKGLSKNLVTSRAQMQRTQLNTYCKGKIQRIDIAVLSRLCHALNCGPGDILEYVPPQENQTPENSKTGNEVDESAGSISENI